MCEDFSYILPLAQSTFEYKHLLLFLPNLKASNGFAQDYKELRNDEEKCLKSQNSKIEP